MRSLPTYCGDCKMRIFPPPSYCTCHAPPAETMAQKIAERDRLRSQNLRLLDALQNLLAYMDTKERHRAEHKARVVLAEIAQEGKS